MWGRVICGGGMMRSKLLGLLGLGLGLSAGSCFADDLASGAQIRAALAGNTVQGSMQASGDYAEFYAKDGAVKAKDYSGSWVVRGNQMCLTYGQDPETCWGVRLNGSQLIWVGGAGDEGNGAIRPGNPNGF